MNIEELRAYCLAKKEVTEAFPFDQNVLVFKVMNKIFVLTSLQQWEMNDAGINLKCEPEYATTLREKYTAIQAGYHMNKKHWNTVKIDGTLSDALLYKLIDHSYECAVKTLPKYLQKEIHLL